MLNSLASSKNAVLMLVSINFCHHKWCECTGIIIENIFPGWGPSDYDKTCNFAEYHDTDP